MTATPEHDYTFEVVVVGDAQVGKTSLVQRFCSGKFVETSETVVAPVCFTHLVDIDGKRVRVQLWDTAGEESFNSTEPLFCRGVNGVVIVYDATQPRTLGRVAFWQSQCRRLAGRPIDFALLANKSDLCDPVKLETGEHLAERSGLLFFDVSARSGRNVDAAFGTLLRILKERADERGGSSVECQQSARVSARVDEPQAEPFRGCACC